jgi:hypothetical protein
MLRRVVEYSNVNKSIFNRNLLLFIRFLVHAGHQQLDFRKRKPSYIKEKFFLISKQNLFILKMIINIIKELV